MWWLLIAAPLVILDLAVPRARRRLWAERLAAHPAPTPTVRDLLHSAGARARRRLAGSEDRSLFAMRPLTLGLVGMLTAGALVLGAGAAALGEAQIFIHGLRYFAIPAALVALLSLVATYTLITGAVSLRPLCAWLIVPMLLVVLGFLAWLTLMHAGTWLEWHDKRTPVVWGSEWFYAEAYLWYLREANGRVISLAAAVAVTGAAVWWLSTVVISLATVLAPRLGYRALAISARVPRGAIAAGAGSLLWLLTQ